MLPLPPRSRKSGARIGWRMVWLRVEGVVPVKFTADDVVRIGGVCSKSDDIGFNSLYHPFSASHLVEIQGICPVLDNHLVFRLVSKVVLRTSVMKKQVKKEKKERQVSFAKTGIREC